jgi:hypothetical protein
MASCVCLCVSCLVSINADGLARCRSPGRRWINLAGDLWAGRWTASAFGRRRAIWRRCMRDRRSTLTFMAGSGSVNGWRAGCCEPSAGRAAWFGWDVDLRCHATACHRPSLPAYTCCLPTTYPCFRHHRCYSDDNMNINRFHFNNYGAATYWLYKRFINRTFGGFVATSSCDV